MRLYNQWDCVKIKNPQEKPLEDFYSQRRERETPHTLYYITENQLFKIMTASVIVMFYAQIVSQQHDL